MVSWAQLAIQANKDLRVSLDQTEVQDSKDLPELKENEDSQVQLGPWDSQVHLDLQDR